MELSQKTKRLVNRNCNPYALVTGAPSGIGYQCAKNGKTRVRSKIIKKMSNLQSS